MLCSYQIKKLHFYRIGQQVFNPIYNTTLLYSSYTLLCVRSLQYKSSNHNYSLHMQIVFTQDWLNSFLIPIECSVLPFISQGKQSDECGWRRMSFFAFAKSLQIKICCLCYGYLCILFTFVLAVLLLLVCLLVYPFFILKLFLLCM